MPSVEFLKSQVKRERRRGNFSYALFIVSATVAIVAGWRYFDAKSDNIDQRADYERRLVVQQGDYERQMVREREINDTYSRRITRLWAANAVLVGSLNWEREKAGTLKAENLHIWRRNRDLQEDKQRLRENWTSELGIDP